MPLLSVQGQGAGWCLVVFLLAFIVALVLKLIAAGYRSYRKLPPQPPSVPEKKPEPVYYIVERKKKRPKKEFGEPKEISFR